MLQAYDYHGEEIPAELIPPELHDIEIEYWRAFRELSTDRNDGGPIPSNSIREYGEQLPHLTLIIREMDEVYLSHMSEKMKSKQK